MCVRSVVQKLKSHAYVLFIVKMRMRVKPRLCAQYSVVRTRVRNARSSVQQHVRMRASTRLRTAMKRAARTSSVQMGKTDVEEVQLCCVCVFLARSTQFAARSQQDRVTF